MARCVIAVVGEAPCQCFSPGGNHTTSPGNFLDRPAPALRPAEAGGDDQGLAERVRVPCGARAGLEGGDARARCACRRGRVEQWIDAYRSREPLGRAFGRRLGTAPLPGAPSDV
jgi:hypothetical protein